MNPFMLWGSYLGLALGLFSNYLLFGVYWEIASRGMMEPWGLMLSAVPPLIGFFAGWKLHENF